MRETFEEVNYLLADNVQNEEGSHLRDEIYNKQYKSDFRAFCNAHDYIPQLAHLKGYMRLASPTNLYPAFDAQFYFHFQQGNQELILNEDEFSDAKWLSVKEALSLT